MSVLDQPSDDNGYELVPLSEVEQNEFEQNALDNVITALGADSVTDILLKVYHLNDITNKEEWCFDCDPEALPLENRLLSVYGGGEFAVRVMTPTPEGRKSLKRKIKISIAKPVEKDKQEIDNSGDNLKNVMSSMMEVMSKNQTNMMQMFRESQLESQNKTQELLITVLGNKDNQPVQPTLLETMAALKALTPDTKDPLVVFGEMMKMNREIKEEMTPETPPAEGSFGQLMEGANKLMDMASNAPKAPPQMAPQQVHQQQPTLKPPEQLEKEQQDMNALMKMKLKSSLNMLNEKAKTDSNPALWADVTIEEVPEQYYQQLMDALGENDEQGFINLMSINPVIEPNKEWFIAFIGEIRAAFVESKEPDLETDLTGDTVLGDDIENKPSPEIETTDNVDTETSELSETNESNA